MAKSKSSSKAVKAEEPAAALKSVKAGRVTKPAEDSKKSKDVAKSAAKAHQKAEKKRKDSVKSGSDSDSDATSASSASSAGDSESDSEMSIDEKPAKVNGAKKAAKAAESDSDDSSASDSEAEPPKAKTNGVSKSAPKDDSSDSSDDSESDADEKPATNGAKADSSDESADDSDASLPDAPAAQKADAKAGVEGDSEADSDSSSDEEDEKPAQKAPEQKKRKAEADTTTPVKRVKHNGEPLSEPSKNLFVGSLSWNIDEEWLSKEFEGFGTIVGVRIITDRDSGRSKGFGYVEFDSVEGATAALDAKQGAQIDGREINIDFGKVRPDRSYNNDQVSARAQKFGDRAPNEPSNTVFVGNISFNADQDMITEAFSEYGTVNGVRLPTDPDSGNMKGFGYVEFGSIEEAQAAVEALNGADIAGRNIRLDFAGARPANGDSPRGGRGRGGFGGGRGRGGFGDRGGRGGRGGRGRGGFGDRGGRGSSTNRGGFGDFKGKKISF